MMNFILNIYSFLSTPAAARWGGFIMGALPDINRQLITYPLSSLMGIAFSGGLMSSAAVVVSGLLPPQIRITVPILSTLQCLHSPLWRTRDALQDYLLIQLGRDQLPKNRDFYFC